MPKIIQYHEDCIGCNSCVEYASGYWEVQADGKSHLKDALDKKGVYQKDITAIEVPENLQAAKHCPMRIIRILDDQGKEL